MFRSLERSLQAGKSLSQIADRVTAVCAWILAWLGVVCLLLSLSLETSAHPPQHVANPSASTLVRVCSHRIVANTTTKFTRGRASPRARFFPFDLFMSADDARPPGPSCLDFRGPSVILSCWLGRKPIESAVDCGAFLPDISEIFRNFRHQQAKI